MFGVTLHNLEELRARVLNEGEDLLDFEELQTEKFPLVPHSPDEKVLPLLLVKLTNTLVKAHGGLTLRSLRKKGSLTRLQ